MIKRTEKQNKKGSALIAVMCVLFIFMALILSMTLAAYQVLAHTYQYAAKEQCRVTAMDYDRILEQHLQLQTNVEKTNPYKISCQLADPIVKYTADASGAEAWSYYNKEEPGHDDKETLSKKISSQFYINSTTGYALNNMGNVSISAYWKFSEAELKHVDDTGKKSPEYSKITLVVTTTCELRKQKYTITSEYKPNLIEPTGKWETPGQWFWSKN